MTLPTRDRDIVAHVNHFTQMTAKQVQSLCFTGVVSGTPCNRALRRLVDGGFLSRIERRLVGGDKGGSGQYVYQLGSAGWSLCKRSGRYSRAAAINYHTLTIVDVYVQLKELERAGSLTVNGFVPEPDCWVTVDGVELKMDMEVDITDNERGRLVCYIEADMGTERPIRITEKLDRYSSVEGNGHLIVFVAHDEQRVTELAWLISRHLHAKLFRAATVDNFPHGMK